MRRALRHFFVAALTALPVVAVVRAQAADWSGMDVALRTVDRDDMEGVLHALSLESGVRVSIESAEPKTIATEVLVRATFTTAVASRPKGATVVTLSDGDQLVGTIVGGDEDAITVDTPSLGETSVSLERVVGLDSPVAFTPGQHAAARWFHRDQSRRRDRILLTNGDVFEGAILQIDEQGVIAESSLGETRLGSAVIVSLRLAALPLPTLPTIRAVMTFRDGSRLTAMVLDVDDGSAGMTLRQDQRINCAASEVARIDFLGGRWEWLSDHQPVSVQHTPMLGQSWEHQADRNVLGGPIRVSGQGFDKGIGVHSRSRLTYDLKGEYRELVTAMGIDDDSGPLANVAVSIRVDGKPRWQLEQIEQGEFHGPVRINVLKASHLELFVDFGAHGDVQDRFNWVETALVR